MIGGGLIAIGARLDADPLLIAGEIILMVFGSLDVKENSKDWKKLIKKKEK